MAPGFTPDWFSLSMRTYTLTEACELMEELDLNPMQELHWRNVKTGAPVYIGYTPSRSKKEKFEMVSSKSNFIPQTNRSPKQKLFLK